MDIKDYIKLCTKVNKNQGMNNVKWSKVPKTNKHLSDQCHNKPLPYHLEMERSLHQAIIKHSKGKKHEEKDEIKDQKFQVLEIRQNIRKYGIGWNTIRDGEKRYKESQLKYATATIDKSSNDSNDSFVTAETTTTAEIDDSFLSTAQDFEYLKISECDEDIQCEVLHGSNKEKERYKRNALIREIIQNKENICPLGSAVSLDSKKTPDLLNGFSGGKKNPDRVENKLCVHEDKRIKYFQSEEVASETYQISKSIKEDSKQKDYLVPKKIKNTESSRKHFMNISDDSFCQFITKKSMSK